MYTTYSAIWSRIKAISYAGFTRVMFNDSESLDSSLFPVLMIVPMRDEMLEAVDSNGTITKRAFTFNVSVAVTDSFDAIESTEFKTQSVLAAIDTDSVLSGMAVAIEQLDITFESGYLTDSKAARRTTQIKIEYLKRG